MAGRARNTATKQRSEQRESARGLRVAILRARFNAQVVDGLTWGACAELKELGARAQDVEVIDVPGAFELPQAALAAARSGRFDAIVALGAVTQGGTDHYEHVAREAASGLMRAGLDTLVPVAFGVLTVRKVEQAVERSAPGPDNKGAEAARAAVAQARLLASMRPASRRRRP